MSLGSSIRSAARATSSGPSSLPIRWRLAGGSALLTLVILCAFAVTVGTLTTERIQEDFEQEVRERAERLVSTVEVLDIDFATGTFRVTKDLREAAYGDGEAARVINVPDGSVVAFSERGVDLGPVSRGSTEFRGWRVENRRFPLNPDLVLQYGRRVAPIEALVRQVRLFLVGGVIAGAGLALLAGLAIARRAMAPISRLTATAGEIQRTRDPSRRVPVEGAEDEVAELARTVDGMLRALDASRAEQEAMLRRQREFVADASHELRTPLTSVLANLELLADTLDGEQGEAARSALRSSHRMRRLVQDLLLLARADARRAAPHAPLDLGEVLVEVAAELEPVTDGHDLAVEAHRAVVDGARDELHRLALNLMENAIRHTPEGTQVRAAVTRAEGRVVLTVEDDGPGIAPELRDRVFERFVRGSGDRGGSFGLGLSIVRAVAESHGGRVEVESEEGRGTRFVVRLPAAEPDGASPVGARAARSSA